MSENAAVSEAVPGAGGDESRRARGRTRRGEAGAATETATENTTTKREKEKSSSSPEMSLSECESVPTPANFHSRGASPNNEDKDTLSLAAAAPAPGVAETPAKTEQSEPGPVAKSGDSALPKAEGQASAPAAVTGPASHGGEPPPKPKRARRKKEKNDEGKEAEKKKEKRERKKADEGKDGKEPKPRKPRGPNKDKAKDKDGDAANNTSSRKKQKTEHPTMERPLAAKQSTIMDLMAPAPAPPQHIQLQAQQHPQAHLQPTSSASPPLQPQTHTVSPTGSSLPMYKHFPIQPAPAPEPASNPSPAQQPASQPPRSSGQNYDPVRSMLDNPSPASTLAAVHQPSPSNMPSAGATQDHNHPFSPSPHAGTPPPRAVFRASASPAISSIIDPPASRPAPGQYSSTPHSQSGKPASPSDQLMPKRSPTPLQPAASHQLPPGLLQESSPMEIDSGKAVNNAPSQQLQPQPPTNATKKTTGPSNGTPSAPSPKPARNKEKEAPPPLPSGSGLLAGTLFGADTTSSSTPEKTGPNIILHIPLLGESNKVINFARMAEEQYGFEAMHPRLAAHKARLARVSAASAALEKNEKNGKAGGDSAMEDDLSVDVERDSELDGDVLMSGMGGVGSDVNGGGNGAPPKRRRRKIEEYDRDDPFVDDSELAWQEHAAASKDGFFVYSGPLIPEGEKVPIERADGTVKRGRGRGRGGGTTHGHMAGTSGRGGRGGGASGTSSTTANRGGATGTGDPPREKRKYVMRKPRLTKAQREEMYKEKAEREKMAQGLAAKPAGPEGGAAPPAGTAGTGA